MQDRQSSLQTHKRGLMQSWKYHPGIFKNPKQNAHELRFLSDFWQILGVCRRILWSHPWCQTDGFRSSFQTKPYSQIMLWDGFIWYPFHWIRVSFICMYHYHQYDYRLGIQIVGSYRGVILQQSHQDSFRYVGSAVPCSSSFCPGLTIGIHTPNSYPRQSTISDHPQNVANLMKF